MSDGPDLLASAAMPTAGINSSKPPSPPRRSTDPVCSSGAARGSARSKIAHPGSASGAVLLSGAGLAQLPDPGSCAGAGAGAGANRGASNEAAKSASKAAVKSGSFAGGAPAVSASACDRVSFGSVTPATARVTRWMISTTVARSVGSETSALWIISPTPAEKPGGTVKRALRMPKVVTSPPPPSNGSVTTRGRTRGRV